MKAEAMCAVKEETKIKESFCQEMLHIHHRKGRLKGQLFKHPSKIEPTLDLQSNIFL